MLTRKQRRALERLGGIIKSPQERPGIAFAMPLEETLFTHFFTAWLEMEQYRVPADVAITTTGSFTWIARNGLAKQFMDNTKCEYLLFLDSDTVPPVQFDFITRLMGHGKDVVSGWYNVKKTQMPTVYMFDHWDEEAKTPFWKQFDAVPEDTTAPVCRCGKRHAQHIQKVDVTGAGCLLIHRSVFEKVSKPWFGHFEGGGTEDMYFAWKCRELGIDWYVDWAVHAAHIGIFAV